MTEAARNSIVGLTAITGVGILVALIFAFGDGPTWLANTYTVFVEIENANGLADGSRVRLNGVDIGFVDQIRLKEDPGEGVRLRCQIERAYDVPADAKPVAASGLLGGIATLHINVNGRIETTLPKDGPPGTLTGKASSFTAEFSSIAERLEGDLRIQLDKFGKAADKFTELADAYVSVGRKVESMIEERSISDVDAGRVAPNITTLLARADRRVTELRQTVEGINKLVNDPKLHEDLKGAAAEARGLAADTRGEIKKLSGQMQANLTQLTERYIAAADDLSKTLNTTNAVIADLKNGKGTMGKLFVDPALYHSLLDASDRLNAVFQDAQLLIQKWKAEGLPVKF